MAVIKCKMCGGDIELSADKTFGVCEHCGTTMTFPKFDDDQRLAAFNRGNAFRMQGEFDKALALYEHIVEENDADAEAHWCCVLCRFGIEYVEDPATAEYMPTCHRASFDSVLEDVDYKAALEYSDGLTKRQYVRDAAKIAEVQRGILATSQNEEPFDVFVSYKETDENGSRTIDATLAQDIYYRLTEKGYRVFFSKITLEGKPGTEYEPYIFAALNSAKVMILVGTSAENINSVWVKNEWSRFMAMRKKDKSKVLIPCYRDMDPYDLPEQISVLKAYDMSQIGFLQDLIHGVSKVVDYEKEEAKTIHFEKETVVVNNAVSNNVAPLLERVFLVIEDGDWKKADDFCEQILNQEPKNALAYLGKMMIELKTRKREQLADLDKPFEGNNSYQKILRFGDEKLVSELKGYINHINERNENNRKDAAYNSALAEMSGNTIAKYEAAIKLFESISGWKDANKQITACQKIIEQIKAKEEADRLEAARKAEEKRISDELSAKKRKKTISITTSIVAVILAFLIVITKVIIPNNKYNAAVELMKIGNVVDAYERLVALNGYKDSAEKAEDIFVQNEVEKIRTAGTGDIVNFGTYEQDNNASNGKEDVEWLVLEKEDNKILLISKCALDCRQYNISYTDVTWETCPLRKWLNETFLKEAFSTEEQAIIKTTTVLADDNPDYSTNPGNSTEDKVFLLSINEVNEFFTNDSARQCQPTEYAVENGTDVNSENGNCWWWLRSPGCDQIYAAYVSSVGSVRYYGFFVRNDGGCVRPAMWINLE